MKTIINEVPLSRLPNADHLSFHSEVKNFVTHCGAQHVNCEAELTQYTAAINEEVNIIKQQRGSAITPELDAIDKERCQLVTYSFTTFDAAEYSPMPNAKEAYAQLLPVIKPFRGLTSRTHSQKTAEIIALVTDLRTEQYAPHVTTLGLTAAIDMLEQKNNQYMAKDEERLAQSPENSSSEGIRHNTDECYHAIEAKIAATIVLSPNENAQKLVEKINALIKQVKHSYNLRTA